MKPVASVSLDLDNLWTYQKMHGDEGWESFSSYLDIVVPRVLRFFDERELTITFFVVGQDAALDKNREAFHLLGESRHEIGNHSFHHEPWMHHHAEKEVDSEIAAAEENIERATGRTPVGFRGPGFSVSHTLLKVLCQRGYRYDASTFPTFLGPLARAYFFMTADLSFEEKEKRKQLFGRFGEGFRPLNPYRFIMDENSIIEIPVTTMPLFRTPIHGSYLLYLAGYSPGLARAYFNTALRFCLWTGVQPSLLLHPLDFMGCDDTDALSCFPAMRVSSETKISWVGEYLQTLAKSFSIRTMTDHTEVAIHTPNLRQCRSMG